MLRPTVLALTALLLATPAHAAEPVDTVDAFDAALNRGDGKAALGYLAPDVLVYESGGQEASRDEYAAEHLQADMEFVGKVRQERLGRSTGHSGDLAWVATRKRLVGAVKGKPVDLLSTETMVLRRDGAEWRIVHIQWSSKPNPAAKK